jgi:uncharacterized protein VirK/YbjX
MENITRSFETYPSTGEPAKPDKDMRAVELHRSFQCDSCGCNQQMKVIRHDYEFMEQIFALFFVSEAEHQQTEARFDHAVTK